jgi:hypothetical protein
VGGDRIVMLDAQKYAAVDAAVEDAMAAWRGGFEEAIGLS